MPEIIRDVKFDQVYAKDGDKIHSDLTDAEKKELEAKSKNNLDKQKQHVEVQQPNKYVNIDLEPEPTDLEKIQAALTKESNNLISQKEQEEQDRIALKKAADEKDAEAANTLAVLLYKKDNNISEAIKYFQIAANEGYAAAKRNLAILEEKNEAPNYNNVFNLYKEAAEAGDSKALNNLGCCYFNGEGTEANQKEAVKCFKQAVKLNDELATVNLANCYSVGIGTRQNAKKAFDLYMTAAEKFGNTYALRMVGESYLNGYGITADVELAKVAYKKAANKGDIVSKNMLQQLTEKTTPVKHSEISANKDKNLSDVKKDKSKLSEKLAQASKAASELNSKNQTKPQKKNINKSVEGR